ncbi:MAG: RnfABCDGE type electron transport complex subunit B [Clostridia bacterium]|nr:RnfABCDGE type electron transport complex subunit B [Clostridia bacterium]
MNLLSFTVETWKTIGIVAGIFAGSAIIIGALILIVGKVFKVDMDEKVTKILENLAGANCGGCGCSGCAGFAEKLAHGGGELSSCHVTSPEKKAEIAALLGIELKDEERTVAVVKCNGGLANAGEAFEYVGNPTCAANASLLGGNKLCKYGCLGCGDCKVVCPESAIKVSDKLSEVDPDRCVSCGACINACPKHIIERIPASAPVYVACSSECKGKDVMNVCKVGCIGCSLCAKKCPHGAITMVNNLPVFDYSKCTGCKTCVAVCPRHIIIDREPKGEQKVDDKAERKAEIEKEENK